jgi:hypothetical protein
MIHPLASFNRTGLLLVILVLLWGGYASADRTFRCGSRIVSVGAYKQQVLEKCGSPDHVETWETHRGSAVAEHFDYIKERYILPRLFIGPLQMERWTYDLGSNRFTRHLLFRNGELIDIETGDKGRK